MADVYSIEAYESLIAIDATYVVRIDIPQSMQSPDTRIIQSGADSPQACQLFVDETLSEVINDITWTMNTQCRIWESQRPNNICLVFDQFTVPEMVVKGVRDFASSTSLRKQITPPSTNQQRTRRDLGGPFDSDHALLVAINSRMFGRQQGAR